MQKWEFCVLIGVSIEYDQVFTKHPTLFYFTMDNPRGYIGERLEKTH